MDGCPIPFYTNLLSPLDPIYVSGSSIYGAGVHNLYLIFDKDMDQAVKPALVSWQVKLDAVPIGLTWAQWNDARTLQLDCCGAAKAVHSISIELLVEDPNLKSADGNTVKPFGPSAVTLPP